MSLSPVRLMLSEAAEVYPGLKAESHSDNIQKELSGK